MAPPSNGRDKSYYSSGNTELARETPVTLKRLEARRKLTRNSTRLVIALVGLPARGKSFIARKLLHYFNWTGVRCKIFNVGRYRREAYASLLKQSSRTSSAEAAGEGEGENSLPSASQREDKGCCDANFFDAHNEQAQALREQVASLALQDMLRWLDDEEDPNEGTTAGAAGAENAPPDEKSNLIRHNSFNSTATSSTGGTSHRKYERVAIFDATNSTEKRRRWVLEECTSPSKRRDKVTGVVFVESVCDDEELLEENYRYKVSSSPDYVGMDKDESLRDLRDRVQNYEDQYETIRNDSMSYIKVFNLSTKLLVNHIYGRMAKDLVPALMSWHIGTRPVFLCRPGQTMSGITTDGEDYVSKNKLPIDIATDPRFLDMSTKTKKRSLRGDSLGPNGKKFREELLNFCYDEALSFMFKRSSVHDMINTGTSISGVVDSFQQQSPSAFGGDNGIHQPDHSGPCDPFPLRILASTMPRASETAYWEEYEFQINQMSNLNPLDKGDFNGLDLQEIEKKNPVWYEKLERDPYLTRFPGGENFQDLTRRLTSVVIDIEQQVIPTLVVSHVSILQCLMAYFRNTPVEQCMSIDVPMHTVIKFEPVRGGGWLESRHPLFDPDVDEAVEPVVYGNDCSASQLTIDEDAAHRGPVAPATPETSSSVGLDQDRNDDSGDATPNRRFFSFGRR